MKHLKVLVLLIGLAFSTSVLAQEKEAEKPKEKPSEKEVEKPKEDKLSNIFRTSNNPDSFIISHLIRRKNPAILSAPIADVTEVKLIFDKTVEDESNDENLCQPTPPGIVVTIKATNPNSKLLVYNYSISGGKIIGQGEKVVWDLSGVKAGTYTITAAVDGGCGFCGKTHTKTVTIK